LTVRYVCLQNCVILYILDAVALTDVDAAVGEAVAANIKSK
jgi:hypothetical protein